MVCGVVETLMEILPEKELAPRLFGYVGMRDVV
jgi:hypothetical protein